MRARRRVHGMAVLQRKVGVATNIFARALRVCLYGTTLFKILDPPLVYTLEYYM